MSPALVHRFRTRQACRALRTWATLQDKRVCTRESARGRQALRRQAQHRSSSAIWLRRSSARSGIGTFSFYKKFEDELDRLDAVQLDGCHGTCNLPLCEIRMACSLKRRRMIGIKDERRGHRSAAAQLRRARKARCRGRRQRATARCSSSWTARWWLRLVFCARKKYMHRARAEFSEHW
jgi:hypothetical protein